ncbi:MAG: hypothetical protein A9Z00_03635 [Thermobacillus sp. ZCTH02-B1]|uniref:ribonuclease H-like domain-containing protein n=1 Tax=Thermobacillus sp. ZCTH02-B1 TaxID=1858795 RepID=UPI000B556C61|nr:ribonuclease H-like domain-containing protein [Thermobacillus sp. ZCTH02-B1]OUM96686.1 MAG: hypothetical protein A9Z00_03635 [Thermobacillus sp. ZCTH02-B1]
MSSLRERMNRLRGTRAPEGLDEPGRGGPERNEAAEPPGPAWTALGVTRLANDAGECLVRRVVYPLDYRHGHHRLGELGECAGALAALCSGGEGDAPAPEAERILFLDLETTGLGVGAGNVPFMAGIAYFEGDGYVIEQALIRHPAEERAMLEHLRGRLRNRPYLATYNGRTFDWPLLRSRFILNGFGRDAPVEPWHLDFLHPSRSIWRNTLASLRLSHVEEERLGIARGDDVPGSMAPAIYFRYLRDGDPAPLADVFRHNELDMLSLACLSIRFGRLLSGGLGRHVPLPEEEEELLRTGLWLERMGRTDEAEALYETLAGRETAGDWCLLLAARDKKCGNWRRAVLLWQRAAQAAERQGWASGEAHIELSMYYEHRAKDYELALRYASAALELATRRATLGRFDAKRRAEQEAIRRRIERLAKKAERTLAREQTLF